MGRRTSPLQFSYPTQQNLCILTHRPVSGALWMSKLTLSKVLEIPRKRRQTHPHEAELRHQRSFEDLGASTQGSNSTSQYGRRYRKAKIDTPEINESRFPPGIPARSAPGKSRPEKANGQKLVERHPSSADFRPGTSGTGLETTIRSKYPERIPP